jgi:hypothetical protein
MYMKRSGLLVIALVVGVPSVIAQRGPAQPPPQLTPEQKNQYQSKIDELDGIVKDLRARKVNEDLIADVDIYAKAGKWLQEFPQGFGNAQAIATYLGVLDQGLARGRQLQAGLSPWVMEKGRKVLGYYSPLDGSVQPMGVTIPDPYDAGKPDRLYVWLHGRSNGLTEASFINGIKNPPQFPSTAYTADVGQLTLDCFGRGNNANHQAVKWISSRALGQWSGGSKSIPTASFSAASRWAARPPGTSPCSTRIAGQPRKSAPAHIPAASCMRPLLSRLTSTGPCTFMKTSSIGPSMPPIFRSPATMAKTTIRWPR